MARARRSVSLIAMLLAFGGAASANPAAQATAAAETSAPVRARDLPVGDPLRPVVLNALRPAIVADLGQPVMFVVQTLRAQGDWAYVVARPQQPDGQPIDFRRTRYRQAMEQGVFDGPTLYALMQRRDQRWTVVDFAIGPSDAPQAGWPDEFGAPETLLGPGGS
ncbi:hypothetical protein ACO2Q1_11615 [Brevundimonas sp. VNH65]|uniref:hypothetical protein n=1 Tax=Brevundimonas sp. VNH65 TaxID=3400917 RepID=UPI003C01E756